MPPSIAMNRLVLHRRWILSSLPTIGTLSCSHLHCNSNNNIFGTNNSCLKVQILWYSSSSSSDKKSMVPKVDQTGENNKLQTGFAEAVKENTKSTIYGTVLIVGLGVTGLMLYTVMKELFSDKSPNGVYSKALDRCIGEPKILDALGEPIKAHGEENRRGRRGHVRHSVFNVNGIQHMRMQFHIQGSRKQGTVHLEVKENQSTGKFEYVYLLVQLNDILRNVVILEDNRNQSSTLRINEEENSFLNLS